MQVLTAILFFILAVSPLVIVHELGHMLVGRFFGVRVDVFSIGFGRSIAAWTDRLGTRWQVGWLPMGGYVKFAGDMGAASEPSDAWLSLPPEERNKTFQSKPVWQRALIVLAGPLTNFVLAIVILVGLFSIYGVPRIPPEVGAFAPRSTAQAAGMRVGDRITQVEGQSIDAFEDIGLIVQVRAGQPTRFVVARGQAQHSLIITPRLESVKDLTGAFSNVGRIGIAPARIDRVRLAPWELPGAAIDFTRGAVRTMAVTLGQVAFGQRSAAELGGPVKMAAASDAMASAGFVNFLFFMAMISINLGFINLLPIPTLDGGHLMFYAAEAVRRKPVGLAAQEWAYRGGLLVLLAFMLFVTVNDLAGLGLFGGLVGLIG